jgi:hypothetical protein
VGHGEATCKKRAVATNLRGSTPICEILLLHLKQRATAGRIECVVDQDVDSAESIYHSFCHSSSAIDRHNIDLERERFAACLPGRLG